jgi:hypothetical protein
MLIFRTTAAHFLDLVINHPSVRPTIQRGQERLSSMSVLEDHRNVCLGGEGGAALFLWRGNRSYEGHIMLLDGSRGAAGLAFGRAALGVMFGQYGALRVRAPVPRCLPAAVMYVRRLGFVSQGRDSEQEFYEMEASQWAA